MPLSDAQLRQRIEWAIARSENLVDEGNAALGHLGLIREELIGRIDGGGTPDPDPTTDPDPTPTGSVDWFSDWRAGDLHDGGKWTGNLCSDTFLGAVVDPSGRDFPSDMAQVYRYEIPNSNQCWLLQASNQWRVPEVGEYVFHRFYMRFEAPAGHAPQDQHFYHQGQYPQGPQYESCLWLNGDPAHGNAVSPDGDYRFALVNDWFRSDPSWYNVYLKTYETYRVEMRMHRDTASTCRYSIRVFDSANQPAGRVEWEYWGPQGATRLEDRVQQVASADSHFRVIEMGYNGSSPTGNFAGGVYNFIGGVAVRITSDANGWIGPYTVTGG